MEEVNAAAATNIIVVPTRELSLRRFYGEGPASEFERFAEDTLQVWRSRRDLNKEEKKALLWSHLGEAV